MNIPFCDLSRLHTPYIDQFEDVITQTIAASSYIGGSPVRDFEAAFATYTNSVHAIGCANGSDALVIALRALDLPPHSSVMVPAMSYAASAVCILNADPTLIPIFVDVDPNTGLIHIDNFLHAWNPTVKALILVHLYGQAISSPDMEMIMNFTKYHDIQVIEDCAQAAGVRDSQTQTHAGNRGSIATYSFYPGKNLGALGDGGCITTNDSNLAARCRLIANLGSRQKYAHEVIGINSRLDALQAKFLQIKLKDLDAHNEQRRQAARLYDSLLKDLTHIRVPQRDPAVDTYHVYYIFVKNQETRAALQVYLKHIGIDTNIHYPTPMNRLECFKHLPSASPEACPNAAEFGNTCLSLPMFPGLTEKEIEAVCKEIHAFFQ